MPKEIKELNEFMGYIIDKAVSADAKKKKAAPEHKPKTVYKKKLTCKATNRSGKKIFKLKLRTKRQLITYVAKDEATVKKIMGSLPGSIEKVDLRTKAGAKKAEGKK